MEKLRAEVDKKKAEIRLSVKAPEGKQIVPLSPEKKRRLLRDIGRLERRLTWLATEESVWSHKIDDLDDMLAELRLNEAAEPLEIDEKLRLLFHTIEEKVDKVKSYAEEARSRAEEVDYLRDADDTTALDALEKEILGPTETKKVEVKVEVQPSKRTTLDERSASLADRARVAAEPITPAVPEVLKRYVADVDQASSVARETPPASDDDFRVKGIANDKEPA